MMHVRIPDFSEPVSVRTPAERRATRAVAIGLHPQALEPVKSAPVTRAAVLVGELLAAVSIIGGGMVMIGLASLH